MKKFSMNDSTANKNDIKGKYSMVKTKIYFTKLDARLNNKPFFLSFHFKFNLINKKMNFAYDS